MKILAFGQIAEITGKSSWEEAVIGDTEELKQKLNEQYPQLYELNYLIAVDKTIIQENTVLANDATIALLPPYSGG